MVTHQNIIRLIQNQTAYAITSQDVMLMGGSIGFDANTWEIWGALLNGARLQIADHQILLIPTLLKKFIKENQITIAFFTAALFHQLTEEDPEVFYELKTLLIGGDVLSARYVEKVRIACPQTRLLNGYGPTENTVFSTFYSIDNHQEGAVPIGRPICNSTAYVMDEQQRLMPPEVAGELCVGGDGVASGYWNRPQLTVQKFIANRIGPEKGRLFRTGDLAKWNNEGFLEFLGRQDYQIKIRGYRIELTEIEEVVRSFPEIADALVMAQDNECGNKILIGFYVPHGNNDLSDIEGRLKEKLPTYMVPYRWLKCEEFPLNANGKVDRATLWEMAKTQSAFPTSLTEKISRSLSPTETALSELWKPILGVEQVHPQDSFFKLGGDSLKAALLATRLQKKWGINLPMKVLFAEPELESLAMNLEKLKKLENSVKIEPHPCSSTRALRPELRSSMQVTPVDWRFVDKQVIQEFSLSEAQLPLYIASQRSETDEAYHITSVLNLHGEFIVERWERAFQWLVNRHASLRIQFLETAGEPKQRVVPELQFSIERKKVLGPLVTMREIESCIKPFLLHQAPLLRVSYVEAENEKVLIIDIHHLIADGISVSNIIQEIREYLAGKHSEKSIVQYPDYVQWKQEQKKSFNYQNCKKYWQEEYAEGIPDSSILETGKKLRPSQESAEYLEFVLNDSSISKIRNLSASNNATVYMVLLSVYYAMLARYFGKNDWVVGCASEGRNHPDLAHSIGMFVNMLPLRISLDPSLSFLQLVELVKEKILGAWNAQEYPFSEMMKDFACMSDCKEHLFFESVFVVQDFPGWAPGQALEIDGVSCVFRQFRNRQSKFPLSFIGGKGAKEIRFQVEYNNQYFDKSTIERWINNYQNFLDNLLAHPGRAMKSISMISLAEQQAILDLANGKKEPFPNNKTLPALLEEQVKRSGLRIAVWDRDRAVTYQELYEFAAKISHKLRQLGVSRQGTVAVIMNSSIEWIASLWGILKSGGSFLSIEPKTPKFRIQEIVSDSKAQWVLFDGRANICTEEIPAVFTIDVVSIFESRIQPASRNETELLPETLISSSDCAYQIYTSGTTGRPKGVRISHRSLVNLCYWHIREFGVDSNDKAAQFAAVGFDASVWEVFPYLLSGAKIVVVDQESKNDPVRLNQFYNQQEITIGFLPTPIYERVGHLQFFTLTRLLTGGDRLTRVFSNSYQLYNNYGPTEGTVVSTFSRVKPEENSISIGRPLDNIRVYVLDAHQNVQPRGVTGEICIAGEGVALGYTNSSQEEEQKFVADPFVKGERMYRTGDLGRWCADGQLEFIGRIDEQVKVRGFRIELAEVEKNIQKLPGIEQVTVVDRRNDYGETQLYAFWVGIPDIEVNELKNLLRNTIPEYMIPQFFVRIEEMPVNLNGKIDKKKLKNVSLQADLVQLTKPKSALEEELLSIWKEVLGFTSIGVTDCFCDQGGNSIKVVELILALQRRWEVSWNVREIFEHSTIREMAICLQLKLSQTAQKYSVHAWNPGAPKNWFCFHSLAGGAYEFQEISEHLADISWLCFDLPNYVCTEVNEICSAIEQRQKEGEIVLVGYSLGGALALAVAAELERRGRKIRTVLLIDSYWLDIEGKEEFINFVLQGVAENHQINSDRLKDRSLVEIDSIVELLVSWCYDKIINAPIVNILSGDKNIPPFLSKYRDWCKKTHANFYALPGIGGHHCMLQGEYMKQNAKIVRESSELIG